MTDIEIAQMAKPLPIEKIAEAAGIDENDIERYGKYKAKINFSDISADKCGKLILVTAMTPTPAGDTQYVIDADTCISCGACASTCPVSAPVEE